MRIETLAEQRIRVYIYQNEMAMKNKIPREPLPEQEPTKNVNGSIDVNKTNQISRKSFILLIFSFFFKKFNHN